jgi:hypothetical protein
MGMKLEKTNPAAGLNLAREPAANCCAACLALGQARQFEPDFPGSAVRRVQRAAMAPAGGEAAGWRCHEQENSTRVPFCHGGGHGAHPRWPATGTVVALELSGGRAAQNLHGKAMM